MKILVLDTAASESGALSILKDVINALSTFDDTGIDWDVFVSQDIICESKNVRIIKQLITKKSWFHRLYFDYFMLPKIVKEEGYEKIISFQNTIVPRTKVAQYVYVHQSIPFVEYKFSITKDFKLWIYQNVISKMIKKSISKSRITFVQTEWMKTAIKKYKNGKNIYVMMPKIEKEKITKYDSNKASLKFFYPATPFIYKNHAIIADALELLTVEQRNKLEFFFTLTGKENENVKILKARLTELQVKVHWLGTLRKEEVYELYATTSLIFPSFIETVGLPLLEARSAQTYIVASDTNFSREILAGYKNTSTFIYNDKKMLAQIFNQFTLDEIEIKKDENILLEDTMSWIDLLDLVVDDRLEETNHE